MIFIKLLPCALLGVICVLIFPDSFQSEITCIPVNAWTLVHVLSTCWATIAFKLTACQVIMTAIGWEVIEQLICPFIMPSKSHQFIEEIPDTLGDILVAIPAAHMGYYINSN